MKEEVSLTNEELISIPCDDITKMYLVEIKKYPLLSKEELFMLLDEYRKGSKKAKDKIVNSNLRLVVSVAYKYKDKTASFSLLDLIQEGNIGLMRAIETYDENQGSFSTYATIWIKQAISRAIKNKDKAIRKHIHVVKLENEYKKLLNDYYQEYSKYPDDNYIKQQLCITDKMLDVLKNEHIYNVKSLNEKIDQDDSDSDEFERFVGEQESSYDEIIDKMDRFDYLNVIKSLLSSKEYYILYIRLLNDSKVTLEELGKEFGITRERVRQYEERALEKIKPLVRKDSKSYERRLYQVKMNHGYMYEKLKTNPLTPESICIFLYIKDKLSFLGQKILYLKMIDQYNYTKEEIIKKVGIDEWQYDIINDNLNKILKEELDDVNKFKNFKKRILKEKGLRIFDINLIEKEDVIDYNRINEKYLNLSLEELEYYFDDEMNLLNKNEMDIIYKYFGNREYESIEEINKKLTLLMFGFGKNKQTINSKALYDTFVKNKDNFTDEQILFLECYVFNLKPKRCYTKLYSNHNRWYFGTRTIEKLELIHYGIYCNFGHKLDIDKYIIVKKDYADELGQEKIKLLDLYYGVNQKKKGIKEIADIYGVSYEQMHKLLKNAKYSMISIYNNRDKYSKIDKSVYNDYILNQGFRLTDEAREVLKLFIIDRKTIDEISEITGLTKTRISRIINNSLSKIDNYRFNIIHFHNLDSQKINEVYSYCKNGFTVQEKKVINDNYILGKSREDIAKENNLPINEVNNILRNFSNLYFSYQIKDVDFNTKDILENIKASQIESILSKKEKQVMSYAYGLKCKYNTEGIKLTNPEICSKINISHLMCSSIINSSIKKIKGRKINLIKPDLLFIAKKDLISLLNDPHLPILSNEREIICSLYGINGYIEKSLDELSKEYNVTLEALRRRYINICVNILKYKNKEIEGTINYEHDILPNLQYFPNCYRILIEEKYDNNLTEDDIAQKYQLTKSKVTKIFNKITEEIYEIIENPKKNKFDFGFYEKNKNNAKLPFYGNKELVDKIFRLYYGMDDVNRKTAEEIIKELNLPYRSPSLYEAINSYMLAFCKLKDGITKIEEFSLDEIKRYYLKNENNMTDCVKNEYLRHFSKQTNSSLNYDRKTNINNNILYDMIVDKTGSFFDIQNCSKEEIMQILKEYNSEISLYMKNSIMTRFNIKGKDFMSGKEMNHLYKILDKLDKAMLIQKPNIYVKKHCKKFCK